jgi:hypothetical protein
MIRAIERNAGESQTLSVSVDSGVGRDRYVPIPAQAGIVIRCSELEDIQVLGANVLRGGTTKARAASGRVCSACVEWCHLVHRKVRSGEVTCHIGRHRSSRIERSSRQPRGRRAVAVEVR